jgi:hypothetical protein
MCVNSLDEWSLVVEALTRLNYSPYYTLIDASVPSGFLAMFWSVGYPDVKVVTRDKSIQEEIKNFRPVPFCPPPPLFSF